VAFTLQAGGLAGIEVTPAEIYVGAATTRLVAIAIQALGHIVPVDPAKSCS
jgi:hypothetical protein